jgi:peptide/nickel transport system substrate-binding protein
MSEQKQHYYIPKLKEQFAEQKIDRRDFLRYSTLLGLSATAAYGFVGKVSGQGFVSEAKAQELPQGGVIRIGMRVAEIETPHAYSWLFDSNCGRGTHEYLTRTGQDNVTRPYMVQSWEASDDLLTWTFSLNKGIMWHSGREFTSEDAIANLQHMLNPESGSSVIGLMKGYMMNDEGTEIWDANALEKVDDHTFRMNLKAAQIAIPEHLFHYPAAMLDPDEGWKFGAGSNGTGPFDLAEHEVGVRSVLVHRKDPGYWGKKPNIDRLEYIDLGDDPSATVGAIASKQVHGTYNADIGQLDIMKAIPHIQLYSASTASTAVARVQTDREEYANPKLRQALRAAIDPNRVADLALRGGSSMRFRHWWSNGKMLALTSISTLCLLLSSGMFGIRCRLALPHGLTAHSA